MSGFLDEMARSSAARVEAARQRESYAALAARAAAASPAPPLTLSSAGFDVIAELKLRSPAAGRLGLRDGDRMSRVAAYARGGAAAVSVLTEPSRFDGSLDHLREAAAALEPLGVPAMRKDFLVDPYQILEARASGAGGVLLIVRMLGFAQLTELLEAALEQGMFVLLEAFDAADLEAAQRLPALARPDPRQGGAPAVLVGINSRDLQTLQVVQRRFTDLAPMLPRDSVCVAESGVASPEDAGTMRALGYRAALIGTALMGCDDPEDRLRKILRAARTVEI